MNYPCKTEEVHHFGPKLAHRFYKMNIHSGFFKHLGLSLSLGLVRYHRPSERWHNGGYLVGLYPYCNPPRPFTLTQLKSFISYKVYYLLYWQNYSLLEQTIDILIE